MTLIGCGGASSEIALHDVTGTVLFNGELVQQGRIQFRTQTSDGKAYSAPIVDGQYLTQAEAGAMSVQITASRIVPGKFGDAASPDEPAPPLSEMYIPEQFNAKTTLTANIVAGEENVFPFGLSAE